MTTLIFKFAYLCSPPAEQEAVVWGRLSGGPYSVSWDAAVLVAGVPLMVPHFQPLPDAGYDLGEGLVGDWGGGMHVAFTDAELPPGPHRVRWRDQAPMVPEHGLAEPEGAAPAAAAPDQPDADMAFWGETVDE